MLGKSTGLDLGSHSKDQASLGLTARVSPNDDSTARLTYFDAESKRHIVPYVIEPSAGVGRCVLAVLCEAYDEEMDVATTKLTSLLEPILIVAMAMVVGFIVLAVLLPIMDIGSSIRK